MRQLALERDELLVVEERPGAEAGAIDDDRLGERHEIARRVELADDDLAAEEEHIAHHRFEIDGWLDPQLGAADRVPGWKRMFARLQDLRTGL